VPCTPVAQARVRPSVGSLILDGRSDVETLDVVDLSVDFALLLHDIPVAVFATLFRIPFSRSSRAYGKGLGD